MSPFWSAGKFGPNSKQAERFVALVRTLGYDDWELIEAAAITLVVSSLEPAARAQLEGSERSELKLAVTEVLKSAAIDDLFPSVPRGEALASASKAAWEAVEATAVSDAWSGQALDLRGALTAIAISAVVGRDLLGSKIALFYGPFNRVIPLSTLEASGPRPKPEYIQYGPNWREVVTLLSNLRRAPQQEWTAIRRGADAEAASTRAAQAAAQAERWSHWAEADTAALLAAAKVFPDLRSGQRAPDYIIAVREAAGALAVRDLIDSADLEVLTGGMTRLLN